MQYEQLTQRLETHTRNLYALARAGQTKGYTNECIKLGHTVEEFLQEQYHDGYNDGIDKSELDRYWEEVDTSRYE
jgi:hypothetical protein